jgi:enterochelin esterase-like enzyme
MNVLVFMRSRALLPMGIFMLFYLNACQTESTEEDDFIAVFEMEAELSAIRTAATEQEAQALADALWGYLKEHQRIPYCVDTHAYFFYKGNANTIRWNGDFNRWGGLSSFASSAERVGESDLWLWKTSFPADARLDYKIVLNGSQWILDPNNPERQMSGFGPNSVLAMPQWSRHPATIANPATPKGTLSSHVISSEVLGYKLGIQVYLPHATNETDLPVVYFTDGNEYGHAQMGMVATILDNMIEAGTIDPVMAVMVDARNPDNLSQNRRMDEYTINPSYLRFFEEELVSWVEDNYTVLAEPSARMIVGTSLGGLNSAYFASVSSAFGMIVCQSPAYWYRPQIFEMVQSADLNGKRWYISSGTFFDGLAEAERMQQLLQQKNVDVIFHQVNEGHSWGAWQQQLPAVLHHFFGKQ